MKHPHIWILVADGKTARFYSSKKPHEKLEPAVPFEMRMPNPPTREQGAGKPGRVHESVGAARHSVQPHTDLHREAKRRFAGEIAELLRGKTQENAFDKLVLVAPPQMMGDLRDEIDNATKARIIGEVVKDLTHLSPTELGATIAREDWFI
jgi:protein required for attachment to host cells